MALTAHEKQLLEVVIGVAGDNEGKIREGIIKALKGENDRDRRNYLWRTLEKAAKGKIHRARKRAEQRHLIVT